MLHIKDRDLVIPGQLIGENVRHDMNCFREGDNVYSSIHGMVRADENMVKVIPSTGEYIPKEGDLIIGVVAEVMMSWWLVDINSPYMCSMRGEEMTREPLNNDLNKYFKTGDTISAKVSRVDEVNSCQLSRPWKLEDGLTINVNPKRIPRVVGRKKSMLNIIKEKTGSKIVVGQNGWIWIKGNKTELAIEKIKKVEREAQTQGLTDRITEMLEKRNR